MASHNGDEIAAAGVGSADQSQAERRIVTFALLMAMSVAALEQTVVSTAMPTIVVRLKGLDIYPWVFSAYLLASTVTTPLYGKLADLVGRKRMLLFGLALFSIGSVLSGCSRNMVELIIMRVIQGLGAGALGPIIVTMIGDLYTLKERAQVQGLFSGVWGASSLIGPAIGGELTERLSWRWVFFVTVPFSLMSAWILIRHVHERIEKKPHPPIDWLGSALLAAASSAILLALLGGSAQATQTTAILLGGAVSISALAVWQERRAPDPVLPLDLLARPTIAACIIGSFILGALLFGIDTYIPLYVQGVLGGSARQAGRTITPLFLTWSISVAVAAKVLMRLGFRWTAVIGSLLATAGTAGLAWGSLHPSSAWWVFVLSLNLIGLGFGPVALCYTVEVQNSVTWGRRGVATGAVIFFRTIGGALGVGLLGAILFYALSRNLIQSGGGSIDVAAALRPETHAKLSARDLAIVQAALARALHWVFLQMAVLAAVSIGCSLRLTGAHALQQQPQHEVPPQDEGLAVAASEI